MLFTENINSHSRHGAMLPSNTHVHCTCPFWVFILYTYFYAWNVLEC